jgi:hypothetical protein
MGTNVESRVLSELLREAAGKFGDIKFCEIRADMCIEGYPDRNTPTILVYKDGDIKRQIVTLAQLKGPRTNMQDIQGLLVEVGAVQENDVRLRRKGDDDHCADDDGNDDNDDWN